ncbi:MAG: serine--tRNA ligase [Actinomycetota bacterium]|nr:serine--tRNA ligase [Actinomycetota bacterium]
MIDIRLVRDQPELVKAALARKGVDGSEVERAAELDARRREVTRRRDVIRTEVKVISKAVGEAKRAGDEERGTELAMESRRLGDQARDLEAATAAVEGELRDLLLCIPNLPAEDAPDGSSEVDNVVLRVEGYDPERYQAHQRVPHWDIGTELGILDLERGAKISGSMFVMYRGAGALLVRALCQLGLDHNADAFEEIRPPTLVRSDTLTATGQLPKFADEAYHVERDDLWAIPTAEVPLTSLARDEVLPEEDLPVRLMAHTSCFRREAGAAGRDTRGLLRVHEFDKVEILAYAAPSQAAAVHADLLARAETVLGRLGLPYRVVDICTGDLGQPHARTFDLEVYAPGCDQWLEVSSVTWFSDYQARRANIRYRPHAEKGTAMVHTVNGSALAVPRVWAALVETNRQPDGSVLVPEVLWRYMGGLEVISSQEHPWRRRSRRP